MVDSGYKWTLLTSWNQKKTWSSIFHGTFFHQRSGPQVAITLIAAKATVAVQDVDGRTEVGKPMDGEIEQSLSGIYRSGYIMN